MKSNALIRRSAGTDRVATRASLMVGLWEGGRSSSDTGKLGLAEKKVSVPLSGGGGSYQVIVELATQENGAT